MFTDAALAIAADASTKWLYNASRRLKRPFHRTLEDAAWWRLTHHLAGRLGIPLVDAARATDLLLTQGPGLARVRLRSTSDDTVAVAVDVARFHDGAALAAAAALHLARPRRRGRPPRETPLNPQTTASTSYPSSVESAAQFARALASLEPVSEGNSPRSVVQLLSAVTDSGVPFVLAGGVAAVFHGEARVTDSLDLIVDLSSRHARSLSQVLNQLGAEPRGVRVREGFHFDSAIVRAVACLALRANGLTLNVSRSLFGVGEFPQVREASVPVSLEGLACRVLSREALGRATATLARLGRPA